MKKTIPAIILLAAVAAWVFSERDTRKPPPPLDAFAKAALAVHTRWEKGDDGGRWLEGRLSCEGMLAKSAGARPDYLPCNPNFIACHYRYFQETVEGHTFVVTFPAGESLPFRRVRTGHGSALLGRLESGGKRVPFALLDTCSEVYLPRRHYAYGPYPGSASDWRWDNVGRDIFVDRHLVRKRDLWEWEGADIDPAEFPRPATGLSLRQMEEHCTKRGKQLMQAHVFDAAAFHPGDLGNPTVAVNLRGPLPWSRGGEGLDGPVCDRIQTAECPDAPGGLQPVSWTGMGQVLGGLMEAQRNPVVMGANLLPSSRHYRWDSPVHRLGRRAFWEGQGQDLRHFNFIGHSPTHPGPYAVGFRCMRNLP